jgi:KTSC domain
MGGRCEHGRAHCASDPNARMPQIRAQACDALTVVQAPPMQRVSLTSRAVLSAGYDATAQCLELEFRSGRIYRYFGVGQGTYDFLLRAASKGGFVKRMIDGRYRYEEVSNRSEGEPEPDLLAALEASLASRARDEE